MTYRPLREPSRQSDTKARSPKGEVIKREHQGRGGKSHCPGAKLASALTLELGIPIQSGCEQVWGFRGTDRERTSWSPLRTHACGFLKLSDSIKPTDNCTLSVLGRGRNHFPCRQLDGTSLSDDMSLNKPKRQPKVCGERECQGS